MKLLRIFYLLFAVLLFTISCSRTNEQLLRAEQIVETAPDSAMTILNKYKYNSLSDKDKAFYGLVTIKALSPQFKENEAYSFLDFSTNFYEQNNSDPYRLALCYHYLGRKFYFNNHYEKSMIYYLKANDLIVDSEHYRLKGQILRDMANIHTSQRNSMLARKLYYDSYKYFLKVNDKDRAFFALISVSRTYCHEKKFNQSLLMLWKIKALATDSLKLGNLLQELGYTHYMAQHIDSGKYYFKKSIKQPIETYTIAFRLQQLADIYQDLKKYDSAYYYSKKALTYNTTINTRRDCYRIITNSSHNLNQIDTMHKYMAKYQDCSDTIIKINSETKAVYLENMHNTEKEAEKSRSWIWYLLISIVFIISSSIYLYLTKHKKAERKLKLNDVNHSQQKAAIRKDIMMKKQTSLLANIERIKTEQKLTEKGNAKFPERVKSIYNELLHIQDQALFFCEMDGALNSIVTKLKTKAPDIKDKELIWSCLHLLDVPTHDMLILLNYESVNSLKRMKGRLALKLGLENATLLNDYLLQLLTND